VCQAVNASHVFLEILERFIKIFSHLEKTFGSAKFALPFPGFLGSLLFEFVIKILHLLSQICRKRCEGGVLFNVGHSSIYSIVKIN